jgi:hypothetical protein
MNVFAQPKEGGRMGNEIIEIGELFVKQGDLQIGNSSTREKSSLKEAEEN